MVLLSSVGHDTMMNYRHPNHGRLVQPRSYGSVLESAAEDVVWAADNNCFQGLDADRYSRMVERLAGIPLCLFVVVPDVVADHRATVELWHQWAPFVHDHGLPAAFVLQDGVVPSEVPWGEAEAVFIGGSTEFKLGDVPPPIIAEANRRGMWAHMGRVNSRRRIFYAASIGCDSVDGTKYSTWRERHLWNGIRDCEAASCLS